jgi:hypothetical protein
MEIGVLMMSHKCKPNRHAYVGKEGDRVHAMSSASEEVHFIALSTLHLNRSQEGEIGICWVSYFCQPFRKPFFFPETGARLLAYLAAALNAFASILLDLKKVPAHIPHLVMHRKVVVLVDPDKVPAL